MRLRASRESNEPSIDSGSHGLPFHTLMMIIKNPFRMSRVTNPPLSSRYRLGAQSMFQPPGDPQSLHWHKTHTIPESLPLLLIHRLIQEHGSIYRRRLSVFCPPLAYFRVHVPRARPAPVLGDDGRADGALG